MKQMKTLYIAAAVLLSSSVFAQSNSNINTEKKIDVKNTKGKLDRSIRPKPGPAPEVKIGKAEKFVLPNGLTVFVVENHKIPKVTVNLSLDLDPMLEGSKNGYVQMAGSLIGTATKTLTKDQINEKIDFIGADLNTSAGGMSGSCLKKHLDTYLTIYSDVLLNSVFKQEELDKLKTQTKSGLATQKNSPNEMMDNLNKAIVYGKDHPYGEVQTEENVDNITLEDCKGYYDQYFKPNVGYVTLVGDITVAEAKAALEKYFGSWQKGDVKKHTVADVSAPLATKVSLANKPGAAQSTVRITYPLDFKVGNPDEIKVAVLGEILGGGAAARLFRNLRETYNFTYGAYSRISSDEHIGNFNAFADVRTLATDSAITQFFVEMNKIRNEKVGVEELEAAKRNMAGGFSIALERPSTVARFAQSIERYNLPADYYQTYLTRLAAVTVDDIMAMAQKYIKPENAHILVVGDKEVVGDKLKKFSASGKVDYYDYKGDAEVTIKPLPAGVTAESILDAYVKAIGGKDAMMKVKDESMTITGEMMGQQLTIVRKKKGPNKSFEEVKMGTMVVNATICDGVKAKQSGMRGSKELTGDELADQLVKSAMNPELKYKELGFTFKALGIDQYNGTDVYKIESTNKQGKKSIHFYDVTTGLKTRTEMTMEGPKGPTTVSTDYLDYKLVGKVKYPHTLKIDQGGMIILGTVTLIEVNKKLKDSEFEVK
jgi:zinc protease